MPLADVVAETDGWYGRFLARTRWDTFAARSSPSLPVVASYRRAVDLPRRGARRPRPPPSAAAASTRCARSLIGTIAGWEWQRHRGEPALPLDAPAADLIATVDRRPHRTVRPSPDRRPDDHHRLIADRHRPAGRAAAPHRVAHARRLGRRARTPASR